MSAFTDSINAAVLSAFAEPFVYRGLHGDVQLAGIFTQRNLDADIGRQGFTDKVYTLDALHSDLSAAGVELRQPVIVGHVEYRITDWQTDATGMSTLSLRPYTHDSYLSVKLYGTANSQTQAQGVLE